MKKTGRIAAAAMAVVLFGGSLFGCAATAPGAGSGQETGDQVKKGSGLPGQGETLHGFTVTERGTIDALEAETATLVHDKSGLTVFLVDNKDPELAFQIAYRVPQRDETDIPHIFEHSIIAASEKYPGTDVFFDMVSKSYNTFINAMTFPCMTCYPLSSMSQDQLEKMMDVYMSCMAAPAVLEDERILDREALRYQLYKKSDPIEMTGTVFAEDSGYLTDVDRTTDEAFGKILYPDTVAANAIGDLNLHYDELSFERIRDTYETYYTYDNAIALLYGDMDFERELAFLDENYLQDAKSDGKNALAEYDLKPLEGFHKQELAVPAYEGDQVEGQSQIMYKVDLSEFSTKEIMALSYFLDFAERDSSPFQKGLREAGIHNLLADASGIYDGSVRQAFGLAISSADPGQADSFYEVIQESLKEVAEKGFSKTLVDSALREDQLQESLVLDQTNIGVKGFTDLQSYFMTTGRTDYYEKCQKVEEAIYSDKEQKLMKKLAKKLLEAKSSCLVTATPEPGLAEEIEAKQAAYLADMKASMTDKEIKQLIKETKSFDKWNETSVHNNDFLIDPKELPDPEEEPEVARAEKEGIQLLSAPVDIEDVGAYTIYFDTSAITKEELFDLYFYKLALEELSTKKYSQEELMEQISGYMAGEHFGLGYPGKEGNEDSHPVLLAAWYANRADFETSFNLIMEILTETDFTDRDRLLEFIEKYREYFNPATSEGMGVSSEVAGSYFERGQAYIRYLSGPEFYSYLGEQKKKLSEDEGYVKAFAKRMKKIRKQVIGKTNLIFTTAAQKEEIPRIQDAAISLLKDLPDIPVKKDVSYGLEQKKAQKIGVYVDTSLQSTIKLYDNNGNKDMLGRHMVFATAVGDKYMVPEMRFKNGAYSALVEPYYRENRIEAWASEDPNVGKTIKTFDDIAKQMKEMELTQEELDGYIISTYGGETEPEGALSRGESAIVDCIEGIDVKAWRERVADIRNATLSDQQKAAENLAKEEADSITVMTGNKKKMEQEAGLFDLILDYKALGK